MHEPASYISLLFPGKTDLSSTNIKPIQWTMSSKGGKNTLIVFLTISAKLHSEINMSKLYFYSDTSEYSAQSNKPLAQMSVWSSSPFISAGRGLIFSRIGDRSSPWACRLALNSLCCFWPTRISINFGCVKHSAVFAVQQYLLISCQNDIPANWL